MRRAASAGARSKWCAPRTATPKWPSAASRPRARASWAPPPCCSHSATPTTRRSPSPWSLQVRLQPARKQAEQILAGVAARDRVGLVRVDAELELLVGRLERLHHPHRVLQVHVVV